MMFIYLISILLFGFVFGEDSSQKTMYDSVIIGAGVSGVTAGSMLAKGGKKVLILEALNRDGGRIHTMEFGDGIIEIGAEWLHEVKNNPAIELAIQNNITISSQKFKSQAVTSDGSPVNQELFREIMEYCNGLISNVKSDTTRPMGEFLKESLLEYLKKNNPEVLDQKEFIYMMLRILRGAIGHTIGTDDWNAVANSSENHHLEFNKASSWGRAGYHTFFDLMLNTYKGGPGIPNLEIKLSTVVTNIQWSPEGAPVTVTTADGTKYEAENVIVTVSLGVLKEKHTNMFTPELPAEKINAIEKISMGYVDKMFLSFDKRWWPEEMMTYDFLWTEEDSKELSDDWTTKVFCATSPYAVGNVITLWISGEPARTMEKLAEDEVKAKCMGLLRRFMGRNTTIPEPTGFIRTKWYTNKYSRGTHSFDNIGIASYPTARDDLAKPLVDKAGNPRIMFAGEATDKHYFGTVHGAGFTGRREAERILGRNNDRN